MREGESGTHLAADEQAECEEDPRLGAPVVLGPHVGQELLDDVPVAPRLLLVADVVGPADVGRLACAAVLLLAARRLLLVALGARVGLGRLVRRLGELVLALLLRRLGALRLSGLGRGRRVGAIASVVGVGAEEGEDGRASGCEGGRRGSRERLTSALGVQGANWCVAERAWRAGPTRWCALRSEVSVSTGALSSRQASTRMLCCRATSTRAVHGGEREGAPGCEPIERSRTRWARSTRARVRPRVVGRACRSSLVELGAAKGRSSWRDEGEERTTTTSRGSLSAVALALLSCRLDAAQSQLRPLERAHTGSRPPPVQPRPRLARSRPHRLARPRRLALGRRHS